MEKQILKALVTASLFRVLILYVGACPCYIQSPIDLNKYLYIVLNI